MARFIVSLTDEERESLEAIRKHRGLRSHADTVRELIRQAASSGLPTPERQAAIRERIIKATDLGKSDLGERPGFAGFAADGSPVTRKAAPKKAK